LKLPDPDDRLQKLTLFPGTQRTVDFLKQRPGESPRMTRSVGLFLTVPASREVNLSMSYLASLALACSVLLAAQTFAAGVPPTPDPMALYVAKHLDVLSIPSSIYPRRRAGANTLADYGFVDFKAADGGVQSIEQDKRWMFGIKIVADEGGIKVLCVQDQAMNNGTYLSQTTIEVKIGPDGLFHGTGKTPINAQCPPYQR
jgi:hypothetical protein